MTLCIAAPCEMNGPIPRIVLCADRRMDFGWAGVNDNFRKIAELAHGWTVTMSSNNWSASDHLVRHLRACMLCASAPLDTTQLRAGIQEGVEAFIRSPDHKRTTSDLLVCGFFDRHPIILELGLRHNKAKMTINTSGEFRCIGHGKYIAETFLLQRDCSPYDGLESTLYKVYEAKKYSEKDVSVGPNTGLAFHAPPLFNEKASERAYWVKISDAGLVYLEGIRSQCGLKPTPTVTLAPFLESPYE